MSKVVHGLEKRSRHDTHIYLSEESRFHVGVLKYILNKTAGPDFPLTARLLSDFEIRDSERKSAPDNVFIEHDFHRFCKLEGARESQDAYTEDVPEAVD